MRYSEAAQSAPERSRGAAAKLAAEVPCQPLLHLDALWIQVAGTRCNLSCTHCFVSCGPGDARHAMMTREQVAVSVAEGLALGVREFYFTGGEPFLNSELPSILADTLAHGPCTVLTNGTLFTESLIATLARLAQGARYSLEIRVSLDGPEPATHDAFRGPGSFDRAIAGLLALDAAGLLPIVTATRGLADDPLALRERYARALRSLGLSRPRIKLLPMFQLGREAERTGPYAGGQSLRGLPARAFDPARLQCGSCRAVTSQGVFVCPLLVDERGARMGARLADALGPFELAHGACSTCYVTGMTCANG